MDRTERFYKIELLIRSRGGISFAGLLAELEVSRATLKRDLEYLRSRLNAPIAYDRLDNGYHFAGGADARAHELPGLWFSQTEIHALLTMHQLILGLDAEGVLGRHLQPLLDKLHGMLGASESEALELMRRIRIVGAARRPVPARFFELVGSALMKRQRLAMSYFSRSRQSESRRTVSPQRLTHWRNTWYLDAWCHASDGLRRFALDAVREAQLLDDAAREVPLAEVETALDAGYGAFAGGAVQWARLWFSAEAAQWVAHEQWHPQQQLTRRDDGSLELRLPYADPTELAMDLLRHGDQAEVLEPPVLRERVARQLDEAARRYAAPKSVAEHGIAISPAAD